MRVLSALEQKNCDLTKIEVYEVTSLMGDVASEVPADNAMPCGIVLLIEFLLYECCDILFNVVFFQSLSGTIHSILLHLLGHVRILDDCLSFRHFVQLSD